MVANLKQIILPVLIHLHLLPKYTAIQFKKFHSSFKHFYLWATIPTATCPLWADFVLDRASQPTNSAGLLSWIIFTFSTLTWFSKCNVCGKARQGRIERDGPLGYIIAIRNCSTILKWCDGLCGKYVRGAHSHKHTHTQHTYFNIA